MAKGNIMRQWSNSGSEYRWRRVWNSESSYVCLETSGVDMKNVLSLCHGEEFVEKKSYLLGFIPVWKKVWKEEVDGDVLARGMADGSIYSKLANVLYEKYKMPMDGNKVKLAV